MAYRDDLYTGEIQQRVNSIRERPRQKAITEDELGFLNHSLDIEEQLGIIVELDGEMRNHVENVPKIFVMKKDENGSDTMMDLKSAGIERESLEFWKQVQLGNVFAYPAGDTDPVQIQVDTLTTTPKISFSKPVSVEALPPAPAPKKPGILGRIGQFFSKRMKERCVNYDNWVADQRINENRMRSNFHIRESSKLLQTEKNEINSYIQRKQERIRYEKNKKTLDDLLAKETRGTTKQDGINNAVTMYQPVPETLPHLLSTEKESKFYTQEQFNKLEKYDDLDLSKIKIGEEGLENEDFAAIAISASRKMEYTLKNPLVKNIEETIDIYQRMGGLSKEEAEYATGIEFDGVLSRDLMERNNEREANGKAIEQMAVPGRRDAKNALQKYNPEDKESKRDLAKIIASGVKRSAKSISTQGGKFRDCAINEYHMAGRLTSLLDRDPDLMALAKEEGMDPKDYKAVKGMAELDRLDTERTNSLKTLYTAASQNKPLEGDEKKKVLKDILKANLAESTIVMEAQNTKDDQKVTDVYMNMKKYESRGVRKKDFENPEDYQKAFDAQKKYEISPEGRNSYFAWDGKLKIGTPERMMFSLREMYNPAPKTAVGLASRDGQEQLDRMVEEIIEKDKLMSFSPSELGEKLKGMNYDGNGLIDKGKLAADAIKAKENAPEPKEINLNLNLNKEVNQHQPGLN